MIVHRLLLVLLHVHVLVLLSSTLSHVQVTGASTQQQQHQHQDMAWGTPSVHYNTMGYNHRLVVQAPAQAGTRGSMVMLPSAQVMDHNYHQQQNQRYVNVHSATPTRLLIVPVIQKDRAAIAVQQKLSVRQYLGKQAAPTTIARSSTPAIVAFNRVAPAGTPIVVRDAAKMDNLASISPSSAASSGSPAAAGNELDNVAALDDVGSLTNLIADLDEALARTTSSSSSSSSSAPSSAPPVAGPQLLSLSDELQQQQASSCSGDGSSFYTVQQHEALAKQQQQTPVVQIVSSAGELNEMAPPQIAISPNSAAPLQQQMQSNKKKKRDTTLEALPATAGSPAVAGSLEVPAVAGSPTVAGSLEVPAGPVADAGSVAEVPAAAVAGSPAPAVAGSAPAAAGLAPIVAGPAPIVAGPAPITPMIPAAAGPVAALPAAAGPVAVVAGPAPMTPAVAGPVPAAAGPAPIVAGPVASSAVVGPSAEPLMERVDTVAPTVAVPPVQGQLAQSIGLAAGSAVSAATANGDEFASVARQLNELRTDIDRIIANLESSKGLDGSATSATGGGSASPSAATRFYITVFRALRSYVVTIERQIERAASQQQQQQQASAQGVTGAAGGAAGSGGVAGANQRAQLLKDGLLSVRAKIGAIKLKLDELVMRLKIRLTLRPLHMLTGALANEPVAPAAAASSPGAPVGGATLGAPPVAVASASPFYGAPAPVLYKPINAPYRRSVWF